MQKDIKALLKRSCFIIAITITLLIAFLSLIKLRKDPIGVEISNLDKIEHFIAYFFLGFSWLFTFKESKKLISKNYLIVFGCIFYGIIIEVLQMTLTSYRQASFLDAVANSLGVLIALLIFNKFFKKNKLFRVKACISHNNLIKLANY